LRQISLQILNVLFTTLKKNNNPQFTSSEQWSLCGLMLHHHHLLVILVFCSAAILSLVLFLLSVIMPTAILLSLFRARVVIYHAVYGQNRIRQD
jgi:hypothetical protein